MVSGHVLLLLKPLDGLPELKWNSIEFAPVGIVKVTSKSPLASPTSRPAEDALTNQYEQKLTCVLEQLTKLKRDEVVIHVAASDTSSQLEKLRQLAEIVYTVLEDVTNLVGDAH
ncbi:hypothetical protein AAVH_10795 [Aphelenchoides avenae]|nr:hypothetical protein AAVH_10795 [Aphelenchus avenae]